MSVPRSLALPAGTRARRLPVRGHELAALDLAPAGTAEGHALLVPGFTGSKEDFLPVLAPLAAAGYRVVSIDLLGQYESDQPADDAEASVQALAADVGALLADLVTEAGEPVHVVGHSFGGLVVRRTALTDASGFASLTLLGSGPAAIGGSRADALHFLRPVLADGGLPAVWEASQQLAAAEPEAEEVPPEVQAFLKRRFFASSEVGLVAMADALLAEPDLVEALRGLGLPLLVAHGEADDAWAPAVQKEMAARLGARYDVIADALHSPAVQAPEATAALLADFWASAG